MAEQKIYPADTVDSAGKSWPTVGENIRNGKKSSVEESVKEIVSSAIDDMLDAMYPIGCTYLGEIPALLQRKFKWEAGTPDGSTTGGSLIAVHQTVGTAPSWNTYYTSVVLRSPEELTAFNSATGLNITRGAFQIPIFHRVG